MSAMTLSAPGTCIVVSRPACWQWSMNASPRRSRPAVGVFAFDAIFSTQLTVGVLSHSVPIGACLIQGPLSRMTPTANTSAASSGSELVRLPLGLLSEITSDAMSGGNLSRQTHGCIGSASENQTPPAPSAAASWYPAKCGMLGTSSLTWVGRELRSFNSEMMSSNAARSSELAPRPISFGLPRMAAFIGVKNPFAAGRMMDACRSFPTSIWRALRGTVLRRRSVCVALMYAFAFAAGRWTVRRMPSNSTPIISLRVTKLPSPWSIFFREIGSFPPSCLVILGVGKRAWMPCTAARRIFGMCVPSVD